MLTRFDQGIQSHSGYFHDRIGRRSRCAFDQHLQEELIDSDERHRAIQAGAKNVRLREILFAILIIQALADVANALVIRLRCRVVIEYSVSEAEGATRLFPVIDAHTVAIAHTRQRPLHRLVAHRVAGPLRTGEQLRRQEG